MRLRRLFETITHGGHHGPTVSYGRRPDGGGILRVVQGTSGMDIPLSATQADELATVLLQGVYDAQQRRDYWPTRHHDWPDAATWRAAPNS